MKNLNFELTNKLALSKADLQKLYSWQKAYRENAHDEYRETSKKERDEEKIQQIYEKKEKLEMELVHAMSGIIEIAELKCRRGKAK